MTHIIQRLDTKFLKEIDLDFKSKHLHGLRPLYDEWSWLEEDAMKCTAEKTRRITLELHLRGVEVEIIPPLTSKSRKKKGN